MNEEEYIRMRGWIPRSQHTEKRFFTDNFFIDTYGPIVGAYGVAIYSVLLRFSNPKGRGAFPSHTTIAKRVACSRDKVIKVMKQLEKLKLVGVIRWRGDDGEQTSNRYVILEPPAIPKTTPPVVEDDTPCSSQLHPPVVEDDTINPHLINPHLSIPALSAPALEIDLDTLSKEESNAGYKREDYTYRCDECGEEVTQEQDTCSGCGRLVIWKNSRIWKKAWGDWRQRLREPYTADDAAFMHLVVKANEQSVRTWSEFGSRQQLRDWKKLVKDFGPAIISQWIDVYWNKGERHNKLVIMVMNSVSKYQGPPAKQGEKRLIPLRPELGEGHRFNSDAQDLGEENIETR